MAQTGTASSEYTSQDRRRILAAACTGWGLEYFNFMLPTLMAPEIQKGFGVNAGVFGMAIFIQLIGSACGGLMFGWLGDRFGRRRTLIWSILIYSLATGLVFFAPNFAIFTILRFFAGFGTGGEWAVGFAWLNEAWQPKRRGLSGGIVQASLWPAYALAILATQLVPYWRATFLIGLVPALACVWIRLSCRESRQWEELQRRKAAGTLSGEVAGVANRSAWAQLLRRDSLPYIGIGLLVAFGAQWVSYTATTWMPSLLTDNLGFTKGASSLVLYGASAASYVGFIACAAWSDKVGRRRAVLTFGAIQSVVFAIMLIMALSGTGLGSFPVLYLVSSLFLGYFGVFGVWFGELFPTRIRSLGSAAAYNVGRGLSGFGTLIGGIVAASSGYGIAVSIAVVGSVIVALAAVFLRDRTGRVITAEE